jgi:hypothetical protein
VQDAYPGVGRRLSPQATQERIDASENFANAASGNVHVFISQPLTNFQNVWFNYELPLLALT